MKVRVGKHPIAGRVVGEEARRRILEGARRSRPAVGEMAARRVRRSDFALFGMAGQRGSGRGVFSRSTDLVGRLGCSVGRACRLTVRGLVLPEGFPAVGIRLFGAGWPFRTPQQLAAGSAKSGRLNHAVPKVAGVWLLRHLRPSGAIAFDGRAGSPGCASVWRGTGPADSACARARIGLSVGWRACRARFGIWR